MLSKVETGGSYGILQDNQLTGTLPTEMGLMVQMTDNFVVNANDFTGAIPTQLGNLVKMTFVDAMRPTSAQTDSDIAYYHFGIKILLLSYKLGHRLTA